MLEADAVVVARVVLALLCLTVGLRARPGRFVGLPADRVVWGAGALALGIGPYSSALTWSCCGVAFVAFVASRFVASTPPSPHTSAEPDAEAESDSNRPSPLRSLEAASRIVVVAPTSNALEVIGPLLDHYEAVVETDLRTGVFTDPRRIDFDLVVVAGPFEGDVQALLKDIGAIPTLQDVPVLVVQARAISAVESSAILEYGAADLLTGEFTARELIARAENLVNMKRTRDALTLALGSSRDELHAVVDQIETKHRELEAALHETRATRAMAERAAGMKSNLLRMMAHELRTPVAAVQLQVHLLEHDANGDRLSSAQKEIVVRIRRNLARLLELIETALEYARIESDRYELLPTSFSLQEVLQAVVNDQLPLAEQKSLYLRVETSPMPKLVSDANLVRLIAANLVGNAVKFTQEGGVVVRAWRDVVNHIFTVEDTGPGIPADRTDEVFEPFSRGDDVRLRTGTGSGLGLALVKEMVNALGGTIALRTGPLGGTSFEVTVPSVARAKPENDPALAPSAPPG